MIRTLAVLALFISGCGPSRLKDLQATTLTIRTEVSVWLSLSAAGTPDTGCPKLEETAKATVDGRPMTRLTAGGVSSPSLLFAQAPVCMAATFDAKGFVEDGGVSEFVLSDEGSSFSLQLARPRGVRDLSVANDAGTLQIGQRATLLWPTEFESLNPASMAVTIISLDGGSRTFDLTSDIEVQGSEVRFTVPAAQSPGAAYISVSSENLTLKSCEGPSACVLDRAVGAVRATLVP